MHSFKNICIVHINECCIVYNVKLLFCLKLYYFQTDLKEKNGNEKKNRYSRSLFYLDLKNADL